MTSKSTRRSKRRRGSSIMLYHKAFRHMRDDANYMAIQCKRQRIRTNRDATITTIVSVVVAGMGLATGLPSLFKEGADATLFYSYLLFVLGQVLSTWRANPVINDSLVDNRTVGADCTRLATQCNIVMRKPQISKADLRSYHEQLSRDLEELSEQYASITNPCRLTGGEEEMQKMSRCPPQQQPLEESPF